MDQPANHPTRRDFLRGAAGAATLAAIGGPAAALAGRDGPTADALILLWMAGGLPHAETFDPKAFTPYAPGLEARALGSTVRSIPSTLDGVRVAETLPALARVLHLGTLVRSFVPGDEATPRHAPSASRFHRGGRPDSEAPTLGARIARTLGPRVDGVPAWVEIGQRFAAADEPEALFVANPDRPAESAGRAFDLDIESRREAAFYGPERFARGCSLARRLVEAGSRFVEVSTGYTAFEGWDAHVDGHRHAAAMARAVDRPIARLVLDLERRGLLERTLVVVASEFSRAPDTGDPSGRLAEPSQYGHHRHYAGASSLLLFGGGAPRGRVIGETADAAPFHVVSDPVTPADLHAAIDRMLGLGVRRGGVPLA